ncbi:MAG: helix-turn-helix transcriptional regulator [Pseudomonadota bacterium]
MSTRKLCRRMDIRTVLARNLKRIREERGYSQEDLAFRADLHRTYVSGVERGVRNPTIVIVQKLAEALEVEAKDLLAAKSE